MSDNRQKPRENNVPTARFHDNYQKLKINQCRNLLCNKMQKIISSTEFLEAANRGDVFYIEKKSMKDIWSELDEKFGQKAEEIKKKLFDSANEVAKSEGFSLIPETPADEENFFTPDFEILSRYILVRMDESWLDNWLDKN